MPICEKCAKWPLLADRCPVCTSAERLLASIANPRIPSTYEAEAKVTKVLDSAFYSISRLVPEDDSPEKGEGSPNLKKAEKANKPVEERGRGEGAGGDSTRGEGSPKGHSGERKESKETVQTGEPVKSEEVAKKEEKVKEVQQSEEKKALPRRREEDRSRRERSKTPNYQKEKDKRKKRKKESGSRSVSGSDVRKKKREDFDSQRGDRREDESKQWDPA